MPKVMPTVVAGAGCRRDPISWPRRRSLRSPHSHSSTTGWPRATDGLAPKVANADVASRAPRVAEESQSTATRTVGLAAGGLYAESSRLSKEAPPCSNAECPARSALAAADHVRAQRHIDPCSVVVDGPVQGHPP